MFEFLFGSTEFLVANPLLLPSLISGGASVLGGLFGKRGAEGAADAQLQASREALAQFEKNAGIAIDTVNDRFSDAEGTIQNNLSNVQGQIAETGEQTINQINAGAANSSGLIVDSSNSAGQTLSDSYSRIRDDVMRGFGFQESEINEAAVTANQFVNAARQRAAGAISKGFEYGESQINKGRELANDLILGGLSDARERLNVARANAIAVQDRGLKNIRSDFQPFIDAGVTTIEGVTELVNNPEAQRDFIQNNPFFEQISNESERRLLENQAASGRVGTGSTQLELRNRLLAIGNQLLDSEVARRMGVVGVGMDAASRTAQAEMNRANAISSVEQATGQSLANLVTTAAQNRAQIEQNASNNLASLGQQRASQLAGIEQQAGQTQAQIESNRGTNVANAAGSGLSMLANAGTNFGLRQAGLQANTGTQLANIETNRAANVANTIQGTGNNLVNANTAAANNVANIQTGQGTTVANTLINKGTNAANLITQGGNAAASGIVGGANAVSGSLQDLGNIALINGIYGPRNTQTTNSGTSNTSPLVPILLGGIS